MSKWILSSLTALSFSLISYAADCDDSLVPFQDLLPSPASHLWGYKEKSTGEVFIEPQFDSARLFCKGLAAVKKGGAWGYIDEMGATQINFQFQDAKSFSGAKEVAAVKNKGAWTLISKKGLPICSSVFGYLDEFSEGLMAAAVFQNPGYKWGYIDDACKISVAAVWDSVEKFHGGKAIVKKANEWAFVDKSGATLLGAFFKERPLSCEDSSIYVVTSDKEEGVGLVSTAANPKLTWGFSDVKIYRKGASFAAKKAGKWGYIDAKTFDWIWKPIFDEVRAKRSDRFAVKYSERWGFLDATMNWAIEAKYLSARDLDKVVGAWRWDPVINRWRYTYVTYEVPATLVNLPVSGPVPGDPTLYYCQTLVVDYNGAVREDTTTAAGPMANPCRVGYPPEPKEDKNDILVCN